jgi:hypothetical protein
MPGGWSQAGLAGIAGSVRFCRRFGYPGRIDTHERVWLTLAGLAGAAEVRLNRRLLGRRNEPAAALEIDVTDLLQVRNELVVQIDAPAEHGDPWTEVALEVRCTAFLGQVQAWASSDPAGKSLHVAGKVVGTSERPLELYVLLDGATVCYATCEATAASGQAFHLTTQPLSDEQCRPRADVPGGQHVVRVDLVNGASIWYAVERFVPFDAGAAVPTVFT